MSKQAIVEVLKRIMKKAIVENAPIKAPEKPKTEPGTKERPTTPQEPKKPRRNPGAPDKKPETIPHKASKGKVTMNEDEMINKIVSRYKSKKK